ncbi:Armadillo-type fold [Trinorchestia longiramus]|nr:Armadillo-type fold [Trinorchestia longiramus]
MSDRDILLTKKVPVSRRSSVCCSIFSEFFSAATTIIAQLDLSTRPQQQQQQQQLQTADALASEYNQLHTSSIDELVANTPKDIQVYDSLMALVADVLVVCCPQMKDSEADAIFEVQHDASSVAPADAEHDNFSSVSDESERFAKSARMSEAQATEEAGDERDCEAVVALSLSLVSRAIREPCVAQHYTLLGALLRFLAAHRSSALNDDSGASADLLELVVSFACDSCEASRHFSDHLLASCLSFLLQLPPLFLHQLVSHLHQPLSTALELGLSYAPVGLSAVACLQRLVNELPASQDENFKAVVRQLVQNSLPALLAYVQNPQREGSELQSRVVSVKLSLLNQHRRVDLRKLKQSTLGSVNSVRDVEQRVLKLLGSVGGDLWKSMATDESVVLRWDDRDHVAFKVPYQHTTLDLHLDRVVPHVAHLALHSSNRQTKVAASEMLHSIIIILIGSGRTSTRPSAPLYRHLFSTCLRLSCDADHVSRHLFVTLVMQCTHYFTCNREYEHPDTMALLHAIMEGLESSSNPALRDFSARCLLEFLVWSRKQTVQASVCPVCPVPKGVNHVSSSKTSSRLTVPESVHPNLKSVMKRIVNLLRHPSACKRIGGCVALNSVYTEVRESEVAVDVWLLELFAAVVACLSLAEVDHAAQPTATLGSTALRRLCRIATHYSAMFNEVRGSALRPMFSEVSDSALRPMFSEVSGSALRPMFSEVSGGALRPMFSVVSGSALRPMFSEVSGGALRPKFSEVSGGALRPMFSEVSGGALRPMFSEVSGGALRPMFSEPSQRRRVPESLQGKPGTLAGLAEWLLGVCGHRASPVRRAVMAVLPDLAPGVHGGAVEMPGKYCTSEEKTRMLACRQENVPIATMCERSHRGKSTVLKLLASDRDRPPNISLQHKYGGGRR